MADTDTAQTTVTLPVVPLPDAVILPGTVATLTLDEDDARAAVAAARAGDGRVVVVPVIDGRTVHVGVVAQVEQVGQLPTGTEAAILRAVQRGVLVSEVVGERSGRWQEVQPLSDARPSPRVEGLVRELRVVLEEVAALRRSRRLPEILRTTGDAGALTDAVTAWSEASNDHRLSVLEATEVGVRVELVLAWAKDHLAELKVNEQIRTDVTEGVEKQQREYLLRQQLAAIRKELGDDDGDPCHGLSGPAGRDGRPGEGARGGREGDRPARAHERPEPRAGLDPHVAGPRPRPAVGPDHDGQPGPGGRPRRPRCGSPRAGRREGPDRRVPRRAQAAPRAWPRRCG